MRRTRIHLLAAAVLVFVLCASGCAASGRAPDYADRSDWAYYEADERQAPVDVFFVCPTVFLGTAGETQMSLADDSTKNDFIGAINMEKSIYDEDARFFAPFYRQAALSVYELPPEEREQYLDAAYEDIRDAFSYYLENVNDGRPILLAGFSQGADMSIRLMKEFFSDPELHDQLIACYAVGWSITEEEMEQYPHLQFAQGADDTGVLIAYNSEAEEIQDSIIVPEGTKTLAINPLSWETGSKTAGRDQNLGACFTDTDGAILREIDHFTGAYIDPVRGTLKVTDVQEDEFPAQLDIFENGVYHVYDYQFFFRNLQDNVRTRTRAFLEEQGADELPQSA